MQRFRSLRLSFMVGVVLLPLSVAAQRVVSIQCPIDLQALPCSSDAECSRVYRDHLCSAHARCSGSGETATPAPNPARAPLLGALSGAVIGFAIGGAADLGKTDEQKEADKAEGKAPNAVVGAAVGAGVGLVLGLTIKLLSKFDATGRILWMPRHMVTHADPISSRYRIGLRW